MSSHETGPNSQPHEVTPEINPADLKAVRAFLQGAREPIHTPRAHLGRLGEPTVRHGIARDRVRLARRRAV
jgi:hypothetical protein